MNAMMGTMSKLPRERLIVATLAASPQSNKALARELGLAVGTVKIHLHGAEPSKSEALRWR
jgi:DNA-binding NarL/FixJ family response regulator